MPYNEYRIRRMSQNDDADDIVTGHADTDRWIQQFAWLAEDASRMRTFVWAHPSSDLVKGFYTVRPAQAGTAIGLDLARIGVHDEFLNEEWLEFLADDAARRMRSAAERSGASFLTVTAPNALAHHRLRERWGFRAAGRAISWWLSGNAPHEF